MQEIYNTAPFDLMPKALQTPENQALSYSIKKGQEKILNYSKRIVLYANLNYIPDEILNLAALELRTQYYDRDASRKVREDMVRQTLFWYMHGGTKTVLEEYLATLYQGGHVEEWYEYGGNPYFFKAIVTIKDEDIISVGDGKNITRRILAYKNVRSWLEALILKLLSQYQVKVEYDNTIKIRTEYYPRYNLAYLKLDGHWALDGSKRLNGYDGNVLLDFYPVQLNASFDLHIDSQTESGSISLRVKASVQPETQIKGIVWMEVEKKAIAETLTHIKTSVVQKTVTEVSVTTDNRLNGQWALNGTRKLNGGRRTV